MIYQIGWFGFCSLYFIKSCLRKCVSIENDIEDSHLATHAVVDRAGRCLVQLFWGRQDQTIPLQQSKKLMELVPQARLQIIENAGHLPHFEQYEVVNPLLIDFLRGN